MITAETQVRIRYGETDQMGVVYYGNYAAYYEVGRVELFRSMGFSYRSLEEDGIQMPVTQMRCKYLKPATYDEVIRVVTSIPAIPSTRITFQYDLYNQSDELINTGETTLVFIDKNRERPVKAPSWFIEVLEPYFERAT